MKPPFERLVDEHGATVLRVCRSMLPAHDAEDAWSETFVAAMRAYPDLPETANTEAWLVTIAHRKAIDMLRATARRPLPIDQLPESDTVAGRSAASELGIPGANDDELWEAVARLPTKQRQAVAYRYAAGMPYLEIAEILGGTVEAARRAGADGLKTLRRTYSGANSEGE